ncbi:MAG: hypothetical protein ABW061_18445 [Polyangiaceae bacterium]
MNARISLLFALSALSLSASAAAKRRHFEPDDLELENAGVLDVDLQAGPVLGSSSSQNHLLLPDFEIGLGLTRDVELDVSGAFTFDRVGGQRHISGDALWVATKLGLYDSSDTPGDAWALGIELGPRFPTVDSGGVGYGALGLVGFTHRGFAWVLNAGTLIDPGASIADQHASSLVCGLDFNAQLAEQSRWSLQSELGAAYYFSPDPHELSFSLGTTYAVSPKLDLSLTALSGFLRHTDHAALLLGVSPQVDLW